MEKMTLGQRVHWVRKCNKINQVNFAKDLGISQTHVSKIEKDVENPSQTLLLLISYKYRVDLEWLKEGIGGPELKAKSSLESCINRYYLFDKDFESFFRYLNEDEVYYMIESFNSFVRMQCSVDTVKKNYTGLAMYIKQLNSMMRSLEILTSKAKQCSEMEIDLYEYEKYENGFLKNAMEDFGKGLRGLIFESKNY